ncbi:MAG TPA: hypothetical protein VGB82_08115 [Alphaproteobacteria bacterium]
MSGLWPWLALAGLGMFHGLNPAMGWLFAVALGKHRQSRQIVLLALAPVAFGHAMSILMVAIAVMVFGIVTDASAVRTGAGMILIVWAIYHWLYGHRRRVRVGMTAGFAGLLLWSFLMATAHGAGLMLVPALIPLCMGQPTIGAGSLRISIAAVGVHTLAMLLVTGAIAIIVYDWLGLEFLRRSWINFDVLWSLVLIGTGTVLIVT